MSIFSSCEAAPNEGHDAGVPLADAGGLDDDQVVRGAAGRDDVGQVLGHLRSGLAGRERPEVHGAEVDGVHPDAVAEEGASALAPGRVHRDHGDAELSLLVGAEAAQELVGQRGLSGATGPRDAEHR
jgi:hypothetical protein